MDYAMLTYYEAVTCPEKDNLILVTSEEKHSLKRNDTWDLVNKEEAQNSKILSIGWVFTKKEDEEFKARLVVRSL